MLLSLNLCRLGCCKLHQAERAQDSPPPQSWKLTGGVLEGYFLVGDTPPCTCPPASIVGMRVALQRASGLEGSSGVLEHRLCFAFGRRPEKKEKKRDLA